jgi:hypothetical protein
MSDQGNSTPPNNDPLQFDVAESPVVSSPARSSIAPCKACAKPITDTYFQVNGSILCATCRASLSGPRGSRLGRALRATSFGVAAAIAGAVLYMAVAAITGFEFALVAIVVGFMVGAAVRKGSGGRGGRPYQILAVVLTYLSVVSINIPLLINAFAAKEKARAHATATTQMDTINISARGPVSDSTATDRPATSGSGMTVAQAGTPFSAPHTTKTRPPHPQFGKVLMALLALLVLAARVPFLAGFSNIIGLVIIGVAVFQAWKLNRRVTLRITGPYRLGTRAAGANPVG